MLIFHAFLPLPLLFLLLGIPFPLSYLLNTCSVSKIQLKYYVLPGNLLLTREGGNSILGSHFGPYVNFYLINLCISLYSSLQPQKLSSVWKSENHWMNKSKSHWTKFRRQAAKANNFTSFLAECNLNLRCYLQFNSVQSLSRVRLFVTPWIAERQASLSMTNSQSSLKLMSKELVMPSSHLILCRPLFLLPPIPPSLRVFSNESTLRMRWPMYWSFNFSIIPSKEHPGLISFRMDWLDLLAVHGVILDG